MLKSDLVKEINPDKVAIYIRWSTEDQGEGTTLDVQMEACRNYIHSQGWVVNPGLIFIDEGYSGASLDRPALSSLRRGVDEGLVDCVVVFKMDRLSRSVLDTVRLVLDEWEDRCFVKSAREPIDTTSHSGRMFFYMLTSYAEWERATIRERTSSGRLKRAQEGRNPGFLPPYGYRPGETPGSIEIVPEEAAVVQRIFEMYSRGAGCQRICITLNQEGIPFSRARRGTHWKPATLKYLLSNRAYTGELNWGLRAHNPRKKRNPNEPGRIVRDQPLVRIGNAFPAIITPALFNLCLEVRRSKPRAGSGTMTGIWTTSDYLLTGTARCSSCGGLLRAKAASGRTIYDYYICTTRYEQGAGACPGGLIRMDELDQQVLQLVADRFGTDEEKERLTARKQEQLASDLAAIRSQVETREKRMNALEQQKAKFRQEYRDELITVTDYKEMRSDIEREQWVIQEQLRELESERRNVEAAILALPAFTEHLDRLRQWEQLTPNERKHLLRRFVDSVLVFKDEKTVRLTINWTAGQADEDSVTAEYETAATRPRRRPNSAGA